MGPRHIALLSIAALGGLLALALWSGGERAPAGLAAPVAEEVFRAHVATALEPTELVRRPAEPGQGPRGQVIEAQTRRPLGGLDVQMRVGREVLAHTLTRADGSFDLPKTERRRVRVEVLTPDWRVQPRSIRLAGELVDGRAMLEFTAAPVVSGILRARLVDERSGEPVPGFLVRVQAPTSGAGHAVDQARAGQADDGDEPAFEGLFPRLSTRSEALLSDGEGRIAGAVGFEAGALALQLLDYDSHDPEFARAIPHEHVFAGAGPPAEVELRIPVGPTYRLDLGLPAGLRPADFHATLARPIGGSRELHRAISADVDSALALFYGGAFRSEGFGQRAPLRGGARCWTRFRAPLDAATLAGREGAYELQVRSADGLWAGTAEVSSLVGIQPGTVQIAIAPRAVLSGVVLDGAGRGIASAWIELSAPSDPTQPLRWVGADSQGRFALRWLGSGTYAVLVTSDRYRDWRATVAVEAGSTQQLEARPEPAGSPGSVAGVLRGSTGQHHSRGGSVTLAGIDYPGIQLSQSYAYAKRGSGYAAAFRFDDVPAGIYALSIHPLDNRQWNERSVRINAPSEDLEFTCDDSAPTFDLEFRAVDAAGGAPLEPSWETVWQGGAPGGAELIDDWKTRLYLDVPEGLPLRWIARAQGYRLARGDETSLRIEGDRRVIEARLQRGWGQRFLVTTREREAIADVELLADEVLVGVSDAQGIVELDLPTRPRRLEFRRAGWRVTWGSIDPAEENFGWGPVTPVHMAAE